MKYLEFHITENFGALAKPYQNAQMPEGVGPQVIFSSHLHGD